MNEKTEELPPQPPDMSRSIRQFVALRDKIKEIKKRHQAELEVIERAKETLEQHMLGYLQSIKGQNIATEFGTAYIMERVSATVADGEVFWAYVLDNKMFELIDKRANAPAVTEHINKHGTPPPGINYSKRLELGVRRS